MSQCAIFIFGTSADVGKTTLAVRLTRAAKEDLNRTPVAYFKVCGTGRLRDLYRVLDAGADLATDFVDAGYPSTYDMPACEYKRLLQAFYHTQRGQKGIMIFEVGGDIIDVNALVAVRYAADVSASIVIVANDAIGAIGARDLAVETVPKLAPIFVATMRQNPQAMAERMCLSEVVDIRADSDVKLLLAKARRHAQRHPTMTNSR